MIFIDSASGRPFVATPLMGADTLTRSPSVGARSGPETQGLRPATPDESTGLPLGTLREPSQSPPLQSIRPLGAASTGSLPSHRPLQDRFHLSIRRRVIHRLRCISRK